MFQFKEIIWPLTKLKILNNNNTNTHIAVDNTLRSGTIMSPLYVNDKYNGSLLGTDMELLSFKCLQMEKYASGDFEEDIIWRTKDEKYGVSVRNGMEDML